MIILHTADHATCNAVTNHNLFCFLQGTRLEMCTVWSTLTIRTWYSLLNVGHYGTVTPHHRHELGHSFADVIQGHYCAETCSGNDVSCCAAVCSKSGTPVMQVAYPRRKTTTDRQTDMVAPTGCMFAHARARRTHKNGSSEVLCLVLYRVLTLCTLRHFC
jgi:hypothetical protein